MIRKVAAAVAVVFGLATVVAGGRVLAGSDPGYAVFRPLLVFNVVMGFAYIATGILVWRGSARDRVATASIFFVNLAVLIGIYLRRNVTGDVATESLSAMSLRTAVWLGILLVVQRTKRPLSARDELPPPIR